MQAPITAVEPAAFSLPHTTNPQALPYFMVRPMEDENPAIYAQFGDPGSLNALLPQLEQALESAMTASSGGPGAPSYSTAEAGAGARRGVRSWERNRQRVLARLEVVRGVPFYGYHGEEKLFVKVRVLARMIQSMCGRFNRGVLGCCRIFCILLRDQERFVFCGTAGRESGAGVSTPRFIPRR